MKPLLGGFERCSSELLRLHDSWTFKAGSISKFKVTKSMAQHLWVYHGSFSASWHTRQRSSTFQVFFGSFKWFARHSQAVTSNLRRSGCETWELWASWAQLVLPDQVKVIEKQAALFPHSIKLAGLKSGASPPKHLQSFVYALPSPAPGSDKICLKTPDNFHKNSIAMLRTVSGSPKPQINITLEYNNLYLWTKEQSPIKKYQPSTLIPSKFG